MGKAQEYAWVIALLATPDKKIGKRSVEMEFITCLAMVVERWTIHLGDGWTKEDARSIHDASVQYTTIKPPSNVPIILKKR